MRFLSLSLAAFAVASSNFAFAQVDSAATGFQLGATPRAVGPFDFYATLASGERLSFDGQDITLVSEDGSTVTPIASLPAFVFPSFVRLDPTQTFVILGESSTGAIYRCDIASGALNFVAEIDLAYDLVFGGPDDVLVSASGCFSNCGTQILGLDITTGMTTLIAAVAEASGPLAVAANGDVFYGLQAPFGSPAGSWSVLEWSSAQVSSGVVLDESDALTFATGLDGSASMIFDPVYGHLLVAESVFGTTSRVRAYDRHGALYSNVAESTGFIANLEVQTTPGIGSFQAFQPAGVRLRYATSDFVNFTAFAQSVTPKRPVGSVSGPGVTGPGAITFTVTDATPNSSFLFILGPQAQYTPFESSIDTGRYLFHTGLGVFRRTGVFPATDAMGTGSHTFVNPGSLQGTRVLQGIVRDANGLFSGTSTMVLL